MTYRIDYNPNMLKIWANLFLIKEESESRRCIGGAHREGDKWIVTVDAPYDPDADSDVRVIGEYDTQAEAHDALWGARYQAWTGND